jgi:hypothetical protein
MSVKGVLRMSTQFNLVTLGAMRLAFLYGSGQNKESAQQNAFDQMNTYLSSQNESLDTEKFFLTMHFSQGGKTQYTYILYAKVNSQASEQKPVKIINAPESLFMHTKLIGDMDLLSGKEFISEVQAFHQAHDLKSDPKYFLALATPIDLDAKEIDYYLPVKHK